MVMLKLFFRLIPAVLVLGLITCLQETWAQKPLILGKEAFRGDLPLRLRLGVGESLMVKSPEIKVKDISLTEPKTADVVVVTPFKINIAGRAPGMTQVVLRGVSSTDCAVFDLEVFASLSSLKEELHELLPGEHIKVQAVNDSIFLSGEVSSAANMSVAVSVAEQFVPNKEKLVNLLEVGGVQQVMLEVRVAEMSRALGRRLGINFGYQRGNDFALTTLGSLSGINESTIPVTGLFDMQISERINALFRFGHHSATWTGLIDLLKEHELIKILAEPTLIATSGQEASFLAGGEIPIPSPEEYGDVDIEYKPYGVGLSFTPIVLSSERIGLKVAPEVSEPDYTQLVYYAGYAMPAFTTRRTSTSIELGDGQSFAIAGLLKNTTRQIVSKYPLLGDIPVLGALFRSSEFQKNETELVIIVTPHLVKPLDMARQSLPSDYYVEPDDFEFYLFGAMEGKERPGISPKAEGMEGEFGYIAPLGLSND